MASGKGCLACLGKVYHYSTILIHSRTAFFLIHIFVFYSLYICPAELHSHYSFLAGAYYIDVLVEAVRHTCAYVEEARPETPAQLMLKLQEKGYHNINFVMPEHVVSRILEALPLAVQMGLRLPLVYNTGACNYAGEHSLDERRGGHLHARPQVLG